ncbi:MAG: phage terminase large subunit family protein [Planctomycetaceae bacterium]|nr:phage terminase large subunit family protein [Planctomycetaceae bacterium]
MACKWRAEQFLKVYFEEKFFRPWSKCHLEVIERFTRIILDGGRVALAMPRSAGKSVITRGMALWALCYGHVHFLVIVAANKKEAQKNLNEIKAELLNNKKLLDDFPEIIYPIRKLSGSALLARGQHFLGVPTNVTWTAEEVVFPTITASQASGAKVMCVGINGSLRGASVNMPDGSTARPDLVMIDDPQSDRTAASHAMCERIEETVNSTICGLGDIAKQVSVIMTCTVIREGDVADRYLDPNIYRQWNGMRYKRLEAMPDDIGLWDSYNELRRTSEKKATAFYKQNRKAMDAGAVCHFEQCFDPRCEISDIQAAMNLYLDAPVAFASEQQNRPIRPGAGAMIADAKTIKKRLSGLPRGTAPTNAGVVTGFIDVHDDLLYWCVCAWSGDFTGWVIDYGTFPEQTPSYFRKSDSRLAVMSERFAGRKAAIIAQGVEFLISDLTNRRWSIDQDETAELMIDKLFVDTGYMSGAIETALRRLRKGNVKPSFGIGVTAKQNPMNQWPQRAGRHYGDHWFEDKPVRRGFRTVTMDVNYWKCQVHDAFRMEIGDAGSLTLFGKQPEAHRMFADHCNAETVQLVSAKHEKHEWISKPNTDNHWFDCLVGCMAAASHSGIRSKESHERQPVIHRKAVTF